jgi:hypothetical protein
LTRYIHLVPTPINVVDEVLQLVSRIPVDRETHDVPKTSHLRQPPKWYQFKPRSLMERRWLSDLGNHLGHERNRLILADEGGMGKTKAAALLIKKIISENPAARILVLVEKRQVEDWYNELTMVMPRIRLISRGGASRLFSPRDGSVHIVRKGSLHHRLVDLREKWNQESPNFSLVVLDECHKNKRESGGNVITVPEERRNYDAEKLVCSPRHSDKVLGLTASPLGTDERDVQIISEKIGIPENLFDFFKQKNRAMWNAWVDLSTNEDFKRIRRELVQPELLDSQSLITPNDIENWKIFTDKFADRLSDLLPVNHSEFLGAMRNFSPTNIGMLRTLFADLTPFAPIMSATLRNDLGEESNGIFRRRDTIKHPVNFTTITEALDELDGLGYIGRNILHSWIEGIYDQNSAGTFTRRFELPKDLKDPRYEPLIEYMVESYNSARETSRRCGTTIFVEYTFGGRRLRSFEDKLREYWERCGLTDVYLNVHLIDGDTDDADFILQSLRDKPTNVTEYDVVIGTSAIEQGVNMEWSDLIVHWDLAPTAQKLDQRTWRLDRHIKDEIMPTFRVVYFLTDDSAQTNTIRRIQDRAKLFDQMLGRSFDEGLWPINNLTERIVHERIYDDSTSGEFLHPESLALSRVWSTSPLHDDPQSQIYFQQQYALVRWLSETVGFEIDNSVLQNTGQIVRQSGGEGDVQNWQLSLRQMSYLASGTDIETMLEWASMENQRRTLLAIDGSDRPENSDVRYRMVSIDPVGDFICRARRRSATNLCVTSSASSKHNNCMLVSIDPVPVEIRNVSNASVELEQILKEFPPALRSYGNLFVVEGDALCRVELGRHQTLLLRLLESTVDQVMTIPNQDIELNRDLLLTNFLKHLLQQLEASVKEHSADHEATKVNLRQLGEPETADEARIELNFKRKLNHLEQSINKMHNSLEPIRKHLDGMAVYRLNVRYAEVIS